MEVGKIGRKTVKLVLGNVTRLPIELSWPRFLKRSLHSPYFLFHLSIVKVSVKLKSSVRLSGQQDNKIMVLKLGVVKGDR